MTTKTTIQKILVFLLFKLNWRKLFLAFSVFTSGSILLQMSSLPLPFIQWMSLPHSEFWGRTPLDAALLLGRSHAQIVTLSGSDFLNSSTKTYPKERKRGRKNGIKANLLLSAPTVPQNVKEVDSHMKRYVSTLTPEEALAYVKNDVQNANPSSYDDTDLYAPLFRNISIFKRSYEWMEQLLKVYIYQEGQKPIFHVPHLTGIYSSEGWFMKLLMENQQFVTKNPKEAHLFYLPYSTRQLQMALYVPNSHNLKPLAVFLRDHVKMIAAKYPFWNRSRGSDHFLVACHDWGPYLLKEHEELMRNTIKALCNADASEKIFIPGKDVSLPETTIRNWKRPLRNVGGKRPSQRPILAFFAGHRHGRVRPILLKHWSDREEEGMRIYGPLPNRVSRTMSYPQHMKSSKYCICPMGYEVNSPRIVEAIYYECVPVIIADDFVPPLSEVLKWDAFSVRVGERDIPRLKEILVGIPLSRYLVLQGNVRRVQKHFLWNLKPVRYDLFHMILHSIWCARI
ncbi:hypothetical protein M569_05421, partial [Genlisea aurea]